MSFKAYLEHGWKLCHIRPGFKGPTGEAAKGWQTREKAITDPAMGGTLAGAGLLHAWSGTCALDIDEFDIAEKWLKERGVDLRALTTARNSVHISSGRPGRDKLLYLLDKPLPSKKLAPYPKFSEKSGKDETYHAFELRSGNSQGESVQDVLPPTIHPGTGRPYEWVYGDELLGDWRALPPIPPALLGIWTDSVSLENSNSVGPAAPSGATGGEIEQLLAQQDPNCDYDTWIKIGAAIHHETQGSLQGFHAWNLWSSRSAKYKGQADLATHWNSFRSDAKNPITLGSLRRAAVAQLDAFPIAEPAPTPADSSGGNGGVPPSGPDGWEFVKQTLEPRLAFVRDVGEYFDMATHGDNGFVNDRSLRHLYCPLMPTITEVDDKGKPKSVKPDPVIYLQNSRSKTIVDSLAVHPGAPRLFTEDGKRFVNRYFPTPIEPLVPLPWEHETFMGLWNRLGDQIFSKWLMKFYAHALKKPGVKIRSAPLIYSAEQGSGKNIICRTIPERLFGSRWIGELTGNVLTSNFTGHMQKYWWLYLAELKTGSTKLERINLTNKIKPWITDDTIEVHPKGGESFNLRNRLQITATSNFEDAVQIDNNDRRWAVCELPDRLSEADRVDLFAFLNSERAPGVLRYIFGTVSLTGFNPNNPAPNTLAKVTMIRAGIGTWESNIIERMANGLPPFHRDLFTLTGAFEELRGRDGPPSTHAIRNLLTKSPFCSQALERYSKHRYFAWRNINLWNKCSEGERTRYMETGVRPIHITKWSDDIPLGIINMSAGGAPEEVEKPLCDLV